MCDMQWSESRKHLWIQNHSCFSDASANSRVDVVICCHLVSLSLKCTNDPESQRHRCQDVFLFRDLHQNISNNEHSMFKIYQCRSINGQKYMFIKIYLFSVHQCPSITWHEPRRSWRLSGDSGTVPWNAGLLWLGHGIHGTHGQRKRCWLHYMGMDQYLLIPFLMRWTSIYQLFWGSPGLPGFWPIPI